MLEPPIENLPTSDRFTGNKCRAVVITCFDYRYAPVVSEFLAVHGLAGDADLISFPGGPLTLLRKDTAYVIREAVALSVRLHRPDELILMAHHDCAFVGGSKAFSDAATEGRWLDDALRAAGGLLAESLTTAGESLSGASLPRLQPWRLALGSAPHPVT